MNSANDGVAPQAGEEFSQVEILTHQLNIDKPDFLKMLYVMKDESFEKEFEKNDEFYKQQNNDGGGYAFPVSDMTLLKRFLLLGYQYFDPGDLSEKEKSREKRKKNQEKRKDEVTKCVERLINNGQYNDVLNLIEELSIEERGIRHGFLFVLSLLVAVKPKSDDVLIKYQLTEAQAYDEAYEKANPDKDLIKIKKEYKEANAYEAQVRKAAYGKVNTICNIPTELFRFIEMSQTYIKKMREIHPPVPQTKKKMEGKTIKKLKKVHTKVKGGMAWGRQRREAIAKFYTDEKRDPVDLLYLLTKYKNWHGWSHKQVIKYAHPKVPPGSNRDATRLVLMYCSKRYEMVKEEVEKLETSAEVEKLMKHIEILNKVKNMKEESKDEKNKKRLIEILQRHGLTGKADGSDNDLPSNLTGENECKIIVKEHIPTKFLNDVEVWEALLKDMPMTAMIRNLTKMASLGMFDEKIGNETEENIERNIDCVEKALSDIKRLKSARINPMILQFAKELYEKRINLGNWRTNSTWHINPRITKVLDSAFYNCFQKAEIAEDYKSGKKFMLFLDWFSFKGADDRYKQAAIAIIMRIWNVEENVEIIGYHSECSDLKELLTKDMTIEEAIDSLMKKIGGEDKNVKMKKDMPMRYAFQKGIEVDIFIVFTCSNLNDAETPLVIALRIYNHTMQRKAKLVVSEMSYSECSISDVKDPNCLDIVGFDIGAPGIVQRFARQDFMMSEWI